MKARKLIGLLMAIVMCLGAVTPLAVSAEGAAAVADGDGVLSKLNVVYEEDFENLDAPSYDGNPDKIGEKHGWWANANAKDANGNYTYVVGNAHDGSSNKAYNYVVAPAKDNMFDFRFTSSKHGLIRDLSQDFVVSFKIYPTTASFNMQMTWKDSDKNDGNSEGTDTGFRIQNGYIKIGGKQTNGKLPANTWSMIDIVYDYDETAGGVNSISARLNGVSLYYTENSTKIYSVNTTYTMPNIDFWRMAWTNAPFSIDDWRVVLGDASPYWYEWYDAQADGKTYFREDFDGTTLPTNPSVNGSFIIGQYQPANGGVSKVENGILYLDNSTASGGMYDLQLYNNKAAGATNHMAGDMTFSMRIKPGETFASTEHFMAFAPFGSDFQHALSYFSGAVHVSKKSNSNVYNDIQAKKTLSLTEFNMVEMMFNYDWELGRYVSVDSYVNGQYLGTTEIVGNHMLYIDHFRTLRLWEANKSIEVDFVNISKGHKSLYEAKTEFVGYQTSAIADNKFNLRLVAVMTEEDYSNYKRVGFVVKATYGDVVMEKMHETNSVYDKIVATEGCAYTEYTAEQLGGEYIFALNCMNVPADQGAITFEVTTYYQLDGMDTFEEVTVKFTVDPAKDIPNADVK